MSLPEITSASLNHDLLAVGSIDCTSSIFDVLPSADTLGRNSDDNPRAFRQQGIKRDREYDTHRFWDEVGEGKQVPH